MPQCERDKHFMKCHKGPRSCEVEKGGGLL
jgi:hypothetical protein